MQYRATNQLPILDSRKNLAPRIRENRRGKNVFVVVEETPPRKQTRIVNNRPAVRPHRLSDTLVDHPAGFDKKIEPVFPKVKYPERVRNRTMRVRFHSGQDQDAVDLRR